jgi:AcrR family transcriptional regulator
LVTRYFGGKEALYAEVLNGGFRIEKHLSQSDDLGMQLAAHAMDYPSEEVEFDALHVLLRASGDPAVAAVVSRRFHAEFVIPLAKRLRGRDAELRAAVIASYVIGLSTMHIALASPSLTSARKSQIIKRVGAAIQACIDGDASGS